MAPTAASAASVVVDLRAVQSPDYRARGIARRAHEEAAALERTRPDLVGAYLLDPEWPPPGALDELVGTGKLHYTGTPGATAAIERASVLHCVSPFELGRTIAQVRPPFVDHLGMRYAVTAHDLIPLHERDRYLAHPSLRRLYMARLEVVRSADAVLTVSRAVASDVHETLGVDAARLHAVGSGVSARFVPPASRQEALERLRLELPEIGGPFVLFPGGNDPRKNIEGLIAAFAALPDDLRAGYGLVVVGDYPAHVAAHFRRLAHSAGIGRSLVITGFVSDETLLLCYQATSLLAFPSLAEGFGLPVAEGLASGAVCCVSDRPPLTELVVDPLARFDPTDPADISAAIARCLGDEALRASLRSDATRTVCTWDTVAERVASVLDALARGDRRPWRRRRRVAVVSPLPPIPSGVAAYSAAMVEAMRAVAARRAGADAPDIEIECFIDGRNMKAVDPEPVGGSRPVDAALFERFDGAVGGYEHVLYVLGNSEYHANALGALRRRPGTVLAHEVRVSGLLALSAHSRGAAPGGLEAAIARNYPGLPAGLGRDGVLSDSDAERYGLYLLKDVLEDVTRCEVFSESARRLAALDAGPQLAGRVGVVPFAVWVLSPDERATVDEARAARPAGPAVISSFGIVDPHKRPGTFVLAVAELCRRGHDVEGWLVGRVSEDLAAALRRDAGAAGIDGRVRVCGEVARPEYLALLGRTDVAVQLRRRFYGECSATVSECLSAGVATVVSATGWLGEIPEGAVTKIDPDCSPQTLADTLEQLLATDDRRQAVADAGRGWAGTRTFEDLAAAVLEALGV